MGRPGRGFDQFEHELGKTGGRDGRETLPEEYRGRSGEVGKWGMEYDGSE